MKKFCNSSNFSPSEGLEEASQSPKTMQGNVNLGCHPRAGSCLVQKSATLAGSRHTEKERPHQGDRYRKSRSDSNVIMVGGRTVRLLTAADVARIEADLIKEKESKKGRKPFSLLFGRRDRKLDVINEVEEELEASFKEQSASKTGIDRRRGHSLDVSHVTTQSSTKLDALSSLRLGAGGSSRQRLHQESSTTTSDEDEPKSTSETDDRDNWEAGPRLTSSKMSRSALLAKIDSDSFGSRCDMGCERDCRRSGRRHKDEASSRNSERRLSSGARSGSLDGYRIPRATLSGRSSTLANIESQNRSLREKTSVRDVDEGRKSLFSRPSSSLSGSRCSGSPQSSSPPPYTPPVSKYPIVTLPRSQRKPTQAREKFPANSGQGRAMNSKPSPAPRGATALSYQNRNGRGVWSGRTRTNLLAEVSHPRPRDTKLQMPDNEPCGPCSFSECGSTSASSSSCCCCCCGCSTDCSDGASDCSCSDSGCGTDPSAPHAFTVKDGVRPLAERKGLSRLLPRCDLSCCVTFAFVVFCLLGLAALLLYIYLNTSLMHQGITQG